MTTTQAAPIGSSGIQGDLWSARARDWALVQEPQSTTLFAAIVERANVRDGCRLLDAGCGAGLFARLAESRGASVAGVDAAPALVEIARDAVPAADLHVGDLERLPFADHAFDLVTGINSFQYAARPVAALGEARRVTRIGGLVIAATWGRPEQCEATAYLTALKGLVPPAPTGAPGPFALSQPGALEALVREAELEPLDANDVACTWTYSDLDTALRGLLSAGPAVRAIRHSGEDVVRRHVATAIQPFRTSRGEYRLENVFRYLVSRTA